MKVQKSQRIVPTTQLRPAQSGIAAHGQPHHRVADCLMVESKQVWVEQAIGEQWIAALRIGISDGRAVVAEVRIFPRDDNRFRRPGEWRGEVLGVLAPVPAGGITARMLHVRLGEALRGFRAVYEAAGIDQWRRQDLGYLPQRARKAPRAGKRRGRPGVLKRSDYKRLARRYLELIHQGVTSPVAKLAAEQKLPATTIKGRIFRCREWGYLAGTTPRKAGAMEGPEL